MQDFKTTPAVQPKAPELERLVDNMFERMACIEKNLSEISQKLDKIDLEQTKEGNPSNTPPSAQESSNTVTGRLNSISYALVRIDEKTRSIILHLSQII